MQHWLAKIAHQSKASESLFAFENVKQMKNEPRLSNNLES
jgi:hypothetical protein